MGVQLRLDMKQSNDDDDGAKSHIEIKRLPLTKTHSTGWFHSFSLILSILLPKRERLIE